MNKKSLTQFLKKQIPGKQTLKLLIPHTDKYSLQHLSQVRPLVELIFHDDIQSIRGLSDCDTIFCDPLQLDDNIAALQQKLCLCRILLKPGGRIYMYSPYTEKSIFSTLFSSKQDPAKKLLSSSGFDKIKIHRLGDRRIIYSGQRPMYQF